MKYKYMDVLIESSDLENQLNALGRSGWELINFILMGATVRCILKKEIKS